MPDAVTTMIAGVGEVIRLAVAPVFLLAAVGAMLAVLTGRLARAVERARVIEDRMDAAAPADRAYLRSALAAIIARTRLMNLSITFLVICALLVSMVVITLFLGAFFAFELSRIVALLFIGAMLSFVVALLIFLREVFIGTASLRIGSGQH